MGEHLKAMQTKEIAPAVEHAVKVINKRRKRGESTERALAHSLLFLVRQTGSDAVAVYDRLEPRAEEARRAIAEAM